ncbi:MAG: ribbon-helix-helix domain-containing protein [Nocardioides sp.]
MGQRKGASPTVRGRVTPTEYAALKTLESQTGRTQSDLVREAVHQLLVDHKLVS